MNSRITFASLMVVVLSGLLGACQADHGLSPGEGYVDVPGGKVWYRIVGSGTATPLLVLHGGPGAPSYYLKPLAALADERPVVFYDQLGAGHSPVAPDTALWTIDRFVRELAAVRQALGLKEVHILGHSWGTMLLIDYMATHPSGVQSIIMASPALSVSQWEHDADSLRETLPDSLQIAIAQNEEAGTTDSPEYQGAVMSFYRLYVARKQPWSPDIDSTFAQFGTDVYNYMWGPSEFTATGTLKDFERVDELSNLHLPVLFTAGEYDEATPNAVAFYQRHVPGAELAIIKGSAHLTTQDQPEEYVRVVRDFLHRVEER
ncbi:MAG: proline iminopeptidase-family hydrolase [Rhodothermales bacterium]